MAVLEGVSAVAVAATIIGWNVKCQHKRRQHHRRTLHDPKQVRFNRLEKSLDSLDRAGEGSAAQTSAIGQTEEAQQSSPSSVGVHQAAAQTLIAAPRSAEGSRPSSPAPPSPLLRELVILDGPPLPLLSEKLPKVPEETDLSDCPSFSQNSPNAGNTLTVSDAGECDLSQDFYLRVPSPPRPRRHRRRHTFSGNRARTFSEYVPGACGGSPRQHCAGNIDDFEGWSLSQVVAAASDAAGAEPGRSRYATYSNNAMAVEKNDNTRASNALEMLSRPM